MKLAYGEGIVIVILAPVVVYLIGLVNLSQMFFLIFALFGIWTIASAFLLSRGNERLYYLEWGIVIAALSTAFIIALAYSAALVLVAIIGVIIYSATQRKQS